MTALLIVVHILVSVILILSVLLQSGKAADLASAFGAQGSQTAFGIRGSATFLAKMTTAAAIMFMITSLTLAIVYSQGSSSEVSDVAKEAAKMEQKSGNNKAQAPATTKRAADSATTTSQSQDTKTTQK
jgi:preprotein translocase subunit SecG